MIQGKMLWYILMSYNVLLNWIFFIRIITIFHHHFFLSRFFQEYNNKHNKWNRSILRRFQKTKNIMRHTLANRVIFREIRFLNVTTNILYCVLEIPQQCMLVMHQIPKIWLLGCTRYTHEEMGFYQDFSLFMHFLVFQKV